MLKRSLTVKYLLIVLIMALVISPALAFYPEHDTLEISLNASYVELHAGPNAEVEMQGFQFIASLPLGNCSPLVWRLSDDEHVTVSRTGYVRVRDGANFDGEKTVQLTCTNEHGCIKATAKLIIIGSEVKGPAQPIPVIPRGIQARAPLFNYLMDMANDPIVPMNKLGQIKFIREYNQSKLYN